MADFPSPIKKLIAAFERLPGIGPKSAQRLAFYLLNTPESFVEEIANELVDMKKKVKICRECFGVGEDDLCPICKDEKRNKKLICVVERAIDVMALENVGGFKGVYHVLGGVVNPLEHIGPEDIRINELLDRIRKIINGENNKIEIIIATNPTMEGEATALYIRKKIEEINGDIRVSRIGSGLPMGADLEYADQATLSRAMEGRREI